MVELIIIATLVLWAVWAIRRMSKSQGCGCGCSGCKHSCSNKTK